MNIPDEQAIKLTKWLGVYANSNFKTWIISPKGERAIMDRLLMDGFLIMFERSKESPSLIECEIEREGTVNHNCLIIDGQGSTRIKALIKAVLAMLNNE